MRRNGWKAGAPALLILVVLAMLAFSDIRFLVLALIVMLVLYPMILLLAWLKLTATEGMTLRLRPQRWTRCDDGSLEIEFLPFDLTEEDIRAVETRKIKADDIDYIDKSGSYYVVNLEKGDFPGFYLIPAQIINDNPTLLNHL